MATYVQLEKSLFASKPIELYRWNIGTEGSITVPDAPAAPGVLVASGPTDVIGTFLHIATEVLECPPTSPQSAVCSGRLTTPYNASVWGAYHGPIGGAGGWYFLRIAFTGLLPDHDYVLRTLAGQYPAFESHGIRWGLSFDPDDDNTLIDGGSISVGNNSEALPIYSDEAITTDSAGEIYLDIGHFDLEVSYANIVYLDGIWLYDAEEDAGPGEITGAGSTTFGNTSYKNEYVFEDQTFTPLEINRGVIDVGGEDKPGSLSVTLPADSEVGTMLRQGLAYAELNLQIIRIQQDAPDDPAIIFDGKVMSFDDQDDVVTVNCSPLTARLQDVVPQALVQKTQCPWQTGDPFTCRVNLNQFTFTGTVSAISTNGLEITVDGASAFVPDLTGATTLPDMFALGIIQKGFYQGSIALQTGDVMTLDERLPTLIVGDTVQLIAGDDRTKETCHNKFQNIGNYGAFSELPAVNPAYGSNLRS